MYPAVVFPDAELWACGYLPPLLATHGWTGPTAVFVGNAVPDQRRGRMVIFRRDGGRRLDAVRDAARLTARVWAQTELEVIALSNVVRALIGAALGDEAVRRVTELSGPVPIPDESNQPQRLMVFEVILRGSDL